MGTNHLKIARRHLSCHRGYAALNISLNILGLAIGPTCALVIFRHIQFELSFDAYHEKSDRIHHVQTERVFRGDRSVNPTTTALIGPAMVRPFPEITRTPHLHLLHVPETVGRARRFAEAWR